MNKASSLKKEPLNLNQTNYYGSESNWKYLSVSQYKDFMTCEAAALAKLKGDWEPVSDPTALLVGNYVHSYFESPEVHEQFKEENKDKLFSSRKPHGLLKAFQVAEQMIDRIKDEPLFNYLWQGEKETIVTGELYGVQWKGKIDLLNVEKGYFIDLKTAAQLDKRFWSDKYGTYVSFIESYGYILQMAVYERLLEQQYGKPFKGYIYAVTKQTPSDIAAIKPEETKKEFELEELERSIDRVSDIKNGEVRPDMCGKCDFCRQRKTLTGFIQPGDLID